MAVSSALADVYVVRRHGSTISPLVSADISMDAETVLIEPITNEDSFGEEFRCTAIFTMRNQSSKSISCSVAFPVRGPFSSLAGDHLNREFSVAIKSGTLPETPFETVAATVRFGKATGLKYDRRFADGATREENVVWDMSWAPHETRMIRIVYDMGERSHVPGSNDITEVIELLYIVRTGALWKGPIGTADIAVRFGGAKTSMPNVADLCPPPNQISYPEAATWIGSREHPTELRWHFENWTPTEDIWMRWAEWRGLGSKRFFHFRLPSPYEGAKVLYTAEMLDKLVARDLELPARFFPDKVATLDKRAFRSLIAEWLYREMFARRGDPFFVGTSLSAGASVGDSEGNWYSHWRDLFSAYGYRGGWYRPKSGAQGTVHLKDLSPIEQKNAAFLRQYFDAGEAQERESDTPRS